MMTEAQREQQPLLRAEEIDATPVYPIIHMIKSDVMHFIDTPLGYDALSAPDLTYTLVRPLEEKYNNIQRSGNMSVVFCFLLCRVHFSRDQSLTNASLSWSRAALCEILAIRCLRFHAHNMLELALAVTTSWPVFSGADPNIVTQAREDRDELEDRVGNAIEMAIISKAKRFIKSSACQRVIDAIWIGKCVYTAESSHSILSDTYKRNPIHFYDPHKAPLLDHYRLKVPAIRLVLEYMNFLILFVLFVFALELNERDKLNFAELCFMIYGLGFCLEKVAAMQEHGIKVYATGTWNGFDLAFVTIFCSYAALRLYGIFHYDLWARHTGIDLMSLIACLMFPRLAFVTLRNNLMVLALRAMIVQFVILMLIAAFCFGGFLYALWTLSRNEAGYSAGQIAWWMLDLWFGLDASGFDKATEFHPTLGPLMMVTYACLSNTLLLTVLVSILSHTFSTISEDAAAEAMFRRAVSTIEGVKADPLFSYLPPINLVALCIMLPLSYILNPRWFHKVNVFMIRLTNFPILLLIALYERQSKSTGSITFYDTLSAAAEKMFDSLPRGIKRWTFIETFSGDSGIDAVFELEDSESALDMQEYDEVPTTPTRRKFSEGTRARPSPDQVAVRRRSPSPRPPPQSSPKRPDRLLPPITQNIPVTRPRVNSLLQRGADVAHSVASPLAQIFQPLVVDEDVPEEPASQTPPASPLVSFGPASRRRLSSMRRGSTLPNIGNISPKRVGFPTVGASRLGQDFLQPLSESPDQNGQSRGPETAEEVEDHDGSSRAPIHWEQRFDQLEERHRRMEDMLAQLLRSIEQR
ncbi:hypothetical protein JAAARDRAFT_520251 [Jaapia argillacea MUCL 33604]|uniref:Ion transport domain-containing protein n=1 Tax=Jaapia argillacea MUCL 33604 TaxID=933084 RepID=A0A067QGK0_9AGAM|nr:hypothetical protein JAAARDRAFT_520251 [Jaapia argillacea MUCL 33604]